MFIKGLHAHPLTLIKKKRDWGIKKHGNSKAQKVDNSIKLGKVPQPLAEMPIGSSLRNPGGSFSTLAYRNMHTQSDAIQLSSWRTNPANLRPTELSIHLKIMTLSQPPHGNMTTVPGFISGSYSISRAEERMISTTRQRFFYYLV